MFRLPDIMNTPPSVVLFLYVVSALLVYIPTFHAIRNQHVWLHSLSVSTTDWRQWRRGQWIEVLLWIHVLALIPIVNTAASVASLVSYWPNHFPKFKRWINGIPFEHKLRK